MVLGGADDDVVGELARAGLLGGVLEGGRHLVFGGTRRASPHHGEVRLDAQAADRAQVRDLGRRLDRPQLPDERRSVLDGDLREALTEVLHELQFAGEPPVPQVQGHGVLERRELLGRVLAQPVPLA